MKKKEKLVEIIYKDIRKEWKTEKKAMEEYITKLEETIQNLQKEAEDKINELMQQIPVENAPVGYMSHIGEVPEEPAAEELDEPIVEDTFRMIKNGKIGF